MIVARSKLAKCKSKRMKFLSEADERMKSAFDDEEKKVNNW